MSTDTVIIIVGFIMVGVYMKLQAWAIIHNQKELMKTTSADHG
jgi:hypothetical protein